MPPHVGVIVNPSARRVACDQCHAQKLRCTKLNNCTVCIRCQRLSRQCIWSPPSRSGRPAKITAEETLIRRNTAREKRRKRSLSALKMTPEEGGRPDSAREHVRSSSVSTLAHTDHNNRPQPTPSGCRDIRVTATRASIHCKLEHVGYFQFFKSS